MNSRILSLIISKLVRIKKDRIVFMSYNGHYSDSPKNIFLEMYKVNNKLQYVWIVDKKYTNDIPEYAIAVEKRYIKSSILLWKCLYYYR